MNSPEFKDGNLDVCNEQQQPLYTLRRTSMRSLVGLYFSQTLLYIGFILILLNNLNVLAPGNYFGVYSWVTVLVFSIGLVINFVSIPHLYFSSFVNFNRDDDFWDKETFWILPLFFFGTFFLYGSQISTAFILLIMSIAVIAIIHCKFILSSWKFMQKNLGQEFSTHHQYFTTLKYLTVYYMLLLIVLVSINPLQQIFIWIRGM
ncbi:MAG: hypothetical protein ACD_14C00052G0004 [uncultured bacterium]|nr:MAG: hypothetical protein ACD_14C00052G0004 [uncultured bacterium]KKQ44523.1 MAG: hypothetical protein US63_C0026G0042 [Candidatus Moranbacteria bacterium GW2011_GWC2_37_8]KKQ62924.1 MAG: hypothetical protein US82_C0004G0041 [Parcubacteria group bacterium GW2011_GWC1_38_22]KKQ81228.1 MAG: hypothetical protein UT03_C0008G0024 [Candidatus Moranbacteria bacterium GW2011_GWD2_38_7]